MKTYIYSIITILFIASSCFRNPDEKNKIVLSDNPIEIQTVLNETQSFLNKLEQTEFNKNFYLIDDSLFINNQSFGSLRSEQIDKIRIPNFTEAQSARFIKNIKTLKSNYITSGFIDRSIGGITLFTYRDKMSSNEDEYDDARHIVLFNPAQNLFLKVLDKKESLYLVAFKDARIR